MTTKQMLLSALILGMVNNAIFPMEWLRDLTLTEQERRDKEQKRLNEDFLDAASHGNLNKMKQDLTDGAEINARDSFGSTALHLNIRKTPVNHDITAELIKNGINVNLKDHIGRSALHHAACNCDITSVKLIVKNKGDLNLKAGALDHRPIDEISPHRSNYLSKECQMTKAYLQYKMDMDRLNK